jgi:hypothetical protein
MCADGKAALEQRTEAVHRLMEICTERCLMTQRLRLAYPVEPVPYDLQSLAMRIGGQG